jgi:hypothetical protein
MWPWIVFGVLFFAVLTVGYAFCMLISRGFFLRRDRQRVLDKCNLKMVNGMSNKVVANTPSLNDAKVWKIIRRG